MLPEEVGFGRKKTNVITIKSTPGIRSETFVPLKNQRKEAHHFKVVTDRFFA